MWKSKFNCLFVGSDAILASSLAVYRAAKLLQPCMHTRLRDEVDHGVLNGFKHLSPAVINTLKQTVADYVIVAQGVPHLKPDELLQWWANVPPVFFICFLRKFFGCGG
jgi:hypothetical protein